MEPRITVITLGVKDLERSFHFHHEGLGFPSAGISGREYEHRALAFFDLNHGMKLALYSRENLAFDAQVPQGEPAATEFSLGYNVTEPRQVDTLMSLDRKAGAKITRPAQNTFWGGYSGYFQDPEGHLWEIVWNPQLLPDPSSG